jgi:hypothetical protein
MVKYCVYCGTKTAGNSVVYSIEWKQSLGKSSESKIDTFDSKEELLTFIKRLPPNMPIKLNINFPSGSNYNTIISVRNIEKELSKGSVKFSE